MLTSVAEHMALIDAGYRGIVQPDAPRIGGITPFLKFATIAAHHGLALAPHYAMEIHLHLAAAYPTEPWVEHFEWLDPLFDESHRDPRRPDLRAAATGPRLHAVRADARPHRGRPLTFKA